MYTYSLYLLSTRKLKGAVLAAVSSPKWTAFYDSNGDDPNGDAEDRLLNSSSDNAGPNGENGGTGNNGGILSNSSGDSSTSDFGGDDEVTAAAVGLVLDSLDDIHCLLEAKNKVRNFRQSDNRLVSLLQSAVSGCERGYVKCF